MMTKKELNAQFFRNAFHKINEGKKLVRDARKEIPKEEKQR